MKSAPVTPSAAPEAETAVCALASVNTTTEPGGVILSGEYGYRRGSCESGATNV